LAADAGAADEPMFRWADINQDDWRMSRFFQSAASHKQME
jgi:hypothetical protein